MIKIIISGTKGGFDTNHDRFCHNLTLDEISEVGLAIYDFREICRFTMFRVEYYAISFSNRFKIVSLFRSCNDAAGTDGYVSVSLLIPHEKRISGSIRELLVKLMDSYFGQYVRDQRVQPSIENIGYFTSIINTVQLEGDEFGQEIDWSYDANKGNGLFTYSSEVELERILTQPYLHPFDTYTRIALMNLEIVNNLSRFGGKFYASPNIITTLKSPITYHFCTYSLPSDNTTITILRFGRYDSTEGRNITVNYEDATFFSQTRVQIQITRPYYKDATIDSTIQQAIDDNKIVLLINNKLNIQITPQNIEYTFSLQNIFEAIKICGETIQSNSFKRKSDQLHLPIVIEGKVNGQNLFFELYRSEHLSDCIHNERTQHDITTDLDSVTYTLSKDSDKAGSVLFKYMEEELTKHKFTNEKRSFTLYIPKGGKQSLTAEIVDKSNYSTAVIDANNTITLKEHQPTLFTIKANIKPPFPTWEKRITFKLKDSDLKVEWHGKEIYSFRVPHNSINQNFELIAQIDNGMKKRYEISIKKGNLKDRKDNNETHILVEFKSITYSLQSKSGFGLVEWFDNANQPLASYNFENSGETYTVISPKKLSTEPTIKCNGVPLSSTQNEICIPNFETNKGKEETNKPMDQVGGPSLVYGGSGSNPEQNQPAGSPNSGNTSTDNIIIILSIKDQPSYQFKNGNFSCYKKNDDIHLINDKQKTNVDNKISFTKDEYETFIQQNGTIKGKIVTDNNNEILLTGIIQKEGDDYNCELKENKSKNICRLKCSQKKLFSVLGIIFFLAIIGYFLYEGWIPKPFKKEEMTDLKFVYEFKKNKNGQDDSVTMKVTGTTVYYSYKDEDDNKKQGPFKGTIISSSESTKDSLLVQIPSKEYDILKEICIESTIDYQSKEKRADTTVMDTTRFQKKNIGSLPIFIKRQLTYREIAYADEQEKIEKETEKNKIDSLVNVYNGYYKNLQSLNISYKDVKSYKKEFNVDNMKKLNIDTIKIENKTLADIRQHINYTISLFESIKGNKTAKWTSNEDIDLDKLLKEEGFTIFFSETQKELFKKIANDTKKRYKNWNDYKNCEDDELTLKNIDIKFN